MLFPGPTSVEKSASEIKLTWLDEQTLEMRLADNTTDKILLTPANNIPGVVVPCVFSGVLQSDVEAVVSVSGCRDKDTTVSIASKKVPDGLIDLAISSTGKTFKIVLQFEGTFRFVGVRGERQVAAKVAQRDQSRRAALLPQEPALPRPLATRVLGAPPADRG